MTYCKSKRSFSHNDARAYWAYEDSTDKMLNVGNQRNLQISPQHEPHGYLIPRSGWNKIKYVTLHLETHEGGVNINDGVIPFPSSACQEYVVGKIVSFAWIAHDDHGNCLGYQDCLIKPLGYTFISQEATELHGIQNHDVVTYGLNLYSVLQQFMCVLKQIPPDGFLIAHNMSHKDAVLKNSFFNPCQKQVWEGVPKCCIMSTALHRQLALYEGSQSYNHSLFSQLKSLYLIASRGNSEGPHLLHLVHTASRDATMTWHVFRFLSESLKSHHSARSILAWTSK